MKLPFPSLLDLLDFTTDQGDRTKTKRDGRKKKGKGKRRRQKAKRSAEPISEAAESLGPSLPSSALAALFSFDACKVFLAGILPRDPAGAPTPGLARNSPISYLRRFVAPSSASLLLRILGCITSLPPHPPLALDAVLSRLHTAVCATAAAMTTTVVAAVAAVAAAAAAAAAGGGAFRNFETLTKSRAT